MMNDESELLRQIHPSFVQQGRVTSQAFRPTPKDEQRLSVYDSDMITPEASFAHYTEILRLRSTGVLSVTVGECIGIGLKAEPDPTTFPEHVVVDFSGLEKSAIETKAKILRKMAVARGWRYKIDIPAS